MEFDQDLDTKGLLCPLPVLKARKRLSGMGAGEVLRVEADDPVAVVDMPHFCEEAGHALVHAETGGAVQVYLIRKGG
ncbi:MAG: sulfurtransferase TusA family protein [Rhodobacter sp.]|nr:sulfurtransferase TusA family protein [Rhodobacter sp.]